MILINLSQLFLKYLKRNHYLHIANTNSFYQHYAMHQEYKAQKHPNLQSIKDKQLSQNFKDMYLQTKCMYKLY